jgi:tRNA nucleotidyltransferase (CCA-adding enzyme)
MLPSDISRDLGAVSAVAHALADREASALKPSQWYPLLAGACADVLPVLGARYGAPAHDGVLGRWRLFEDLRPLVTGGDLRDLGYEPGPGYSEVLRATLDAQLDGDLSDRKQALQFAASRMRR